MNRFLISGLLFLVISAPAWSAIRAPITEDFPLAESVCLVRVKAIDGDKVIFVVTETLRGKPEDVLRLHATGGYTFKQNSEWLLVKFNSKRGIPLEYEVGWLTTDNEENYWVPRVGIRSGKEIYIQEFDFRNGPSFKDKAADGTTGLTLDHIKRLLQQNPYRS